MIKTLLIFFVFFTYSAYAQTFEWAKQMGGNSDGKGHSTALDALGNVYTTGFFSGTTDFDPGPGTFNLTSSAGLEIFISKLDASGNFVWAKQLEGTTLNRGNSITVDINGYIYVTGYFAGTVDFDPSPGVFNLSSAGSADIFILKLDPSGNFEWAKQMGGTGDDRSNSIAVDDNGNVYTTGYFTGTADFDPGAGLFNLSTAGNDDVFIAKLDASGDFLWAKQVAGTADDRGNSVAVDANGNVYTTGRFEGTVDFDPGAGTFNLSSAGTHDVFISKLDPSGNFEWAKQMGGTADDRSFSIAVDNSGNVYTTGYFNETADFDPGSGTFNLTSSVGSDIFVSKLDSSGDFVWAKQMEGTSNNTGFSIALDANSNVYITGSFQGTVDFDPGTGTFNLNAASIDIFISKLDASGDFAWAQRMGGVDSDEGLSIAVDDSGNVYTTGYFKETVDFDPGAGVYNLSATGYSDIFVHKMGVCPVINGTDTQTACDSFTWIDGNTYTTSNTTATYNIVNGAANGCDSLVTLNLTINTVDNSVIDDSPTLTSNAVGATYQWIDCDNANEPITEETNASFTATTNGNYAVIVTENGCTDTSDCITISNVGLEEIQNNNVGLSIYPNPSTGRFAIDHNSSKPVQLKIVDLHGKRIFQSELTKKSNVIDLSNQAAGIYFIDVTFDNAVHERRKIIIH